MYPDLDWEPAAYIYTPPVSLSGGAQGWSVFTRLSFHVRGPNPLLLVVTAFDIPGVQPTIFDASGTNVGRWRLSPAAPLPAAQ